MDSMEHADPGLKGMVAQGVMPPTDPFEGLAR